MKRFIVLVALSALWAHPVAAIESIPSFKTHVEVGADSTLQITETVVYDMDTVERHGLERIIPKQSDDGPNIVIEDVTATRDGEPDGVHLNNSSSSLTIRIGDPDVTMTGEHTYVLSYSVLNGVRYFDDKDEVYWNVIPQEMSLPIDESSATIDLPAGSKVTAGPFCYTGESGNEEKDCLVSVSGTRVSATTTRPLTIQEGMTVAVAIAPGTINRAAPVEDDSAASGWLVLIPIFFIGFVVGLIILVKAVAGKTGLPRKRSDGGEIVVQYDAPKGSTAPEAAYLAFGSRSGKFFTAAVVQLAIDGWLTMKFEKVKKWFWTNSEITFHRKKEGTPSDDILASVMSELFKGGSERTLASLKKDARSGTVRIDTIASDFPKIFIKRGWNEKYGWFNLFTRTTPEGKAALEHLAGLKVYIGAAEKERLEFHNAPEHSPQTFEKLLPFAIALGVDEPWIKSFGDLQYVPEWTSGDNGVMNMSVMSSSLNQLSGSVSSVMNAYSSGTSGSGGGGSSGGGGGGGGGGGW